MQTFIAFLMLMTRDNSDLLKDISLNPKIVSVTLARDRFLSILSVLHFFNIDTKLKEADSERCVVFLTSPNWISG